MGGGAGMEESTCIVLGVGYELGGETKKKKKNLQSSLLERLVLFCKTISCYHNRLLLAMRFLYCTYCTGPKKKQA